MAEETHHIEELKASEKKLLEDLEKIMEKDESEVTNEERQHIIEAPHLVEQVKLKIEVEEMRAELEKTKADLEEKKQTLNDIYTGKKDPIGFAASTGNGLRKQSTTKSGYEKAREAAREIFDRNHRK